MIFLILLLVWSETEFSIRHDSILFFSSSQVMMMMIIMENVFTPPFNIENTHQTDDINGPPAELSSALYTVVEQTMLGPAADEHFHFPQHRVDGEK